MTGRRDSNKIVRIIRGNDFPGQEDALRRGNDVAGPIEEKKFFPLFFKRRN